jgi:hypothetical protein
VAAGGQDIRGKGGLRTHDMTRVMACAAVQT